MRAGFLDLNAVSLEVINCLPQGFHFLASSQALTLDQDQTIIQEVQGVLLFHCFGIAYVGFALWPGTLLDGQVIPTYRADEVATLLALLRLVDWIPAFSASKVIFVKLHFLQHLVHLIRVCLKDSIVHWADVIPDEPCLPVGRLLSTKNILRINRVKLFHS